MLNVYYFSITLSHKYERMWGQALIQNFGLVRNIMYLVSQKSNHEEIKDRQAVAAKAGRLRQLASPFVHIYVKE
jgi:hypothetical protein